jgi:signal transduction histidine kinase
MGMAAVYGIIQNHGGDITIESEAGHGTAVKVYFPAVEPKA